MYVALEEVGRTRDGLGGTRSSRWKQRTAVGSSGWQTEGGKGVTAATAAAAATALVVVTATAAAAVAVVVVVIVIVVVPV